MPVTATRKPILVPISADLRRLVVDACGAQAEVIEVGRASGIWAVHSIVDAVKYLPRQGRRKALVVHDVPLLSVATLNALVHVLEDPPAHLAVFVVGEQAPSFVRALCEAAP